MRSPFVPLLEQSFVHPARDLAPAHLALPFFVRNRIETLPWFVRLDIADELRNGLGIACNQESLVPSATPSPFRAIVGADRVQSQFSYSKINMFHHTFQKGEGTQKAQKRTQEAQKKRAGSQFLVLFVPFVFLPFPLRKADGGTVLVH